MVFSINQIPSSFVGEIGAFTISGPGTLIGQMYGYGFIIDESPGSAEEGNYSF